MYTKMVLRLTIKNSKQQKVMPKNILLRILCFISAVTTLSCKPNTQSKKYRVVTLASPIQLSKDTNYVLLSDYFQHRITVDSFSISPGIECHIEGDSIQLIPITPPQLGQITCFYQGTPYSILIKNSILKSYTLKFHPQKNYKHVQVKGEFNQWNATTGYMNFDTTSNQWYTNVKLKPGKYQYKFVADGKELLDETNSNFITNGMGGYNHFINIKPLDSCYLSYITPVQFSDRKIEIKSTQTSGILAFWQNTLLDVDQKGEIFTITIPKEAKYTDQTYIRAYGYNTQSQSNDILIPLHKGKVITDPQKLTNDDWHNSIMYFVMNDRFMDGNKNNNETVNDSTILAKAQYYGGDLKGITQKIKEGYFKKLGINTLWISPITQNPKDAWGQFNDPNTKFSGYHGYWPITSTTIDYRLGTQSELRELLEVAHSNGIKMVLDYVANHVHQQHNVYQKNPQWATPLYLPDGTMNTEKWDEHRLTTWFDTFLPTLNLEDQQIANYMIDSAIYWIENYDFDGFRHDATKHIPLNFWRALNKRVKTISHIKGKYIYQIGETYGSHELINSYINSGMLDAQFDFNLYDNALPVFAQENVSMIRLGEALKSSLSNFGYHHLMGNITGNQDKPRFISYADGTLDFETPWIEYKRIGWQKTIQVQDTLAYRKMALFHAFNMTIPGIPIIYYGDEYGLAGAGDPDNRRMMQFEGLNKQEQALKNEIQSLINIRSTNMALIYGNLQIKKNTDKILVYTRRYFNDEVRVSLNKQNWTYTIDTQKLSQ